MIRFRLVSLKIQAILRESTIYRRRARLSKIGDGLELRDVYGATMERIKAQDDGKSRLAMAALMWVSHAARPLQTDELCNALAVELGSKNFNAGNAPSISTLLGWCQGLITVDKEASTVQLIHPTVKEYLSACRDIFSRPHSTMAEICLTYLNSKQVQEIPASDSLDTSHTPFLGYCSVHWGAHAKKDLSDHARSLALDLFRGYNHHISSKLLLKQVKCLDRWGRARNFGSNVFKNTTSPFSALHCVSFFGIVELVPNFTKNERSINARDIRGSTPLVWAARNGHVEVVEMFLGYLRATPTSVIIRSLHRCCMPFGMGMSEWRKYYSVIKRSNPTCQMATGERPSHTLLRVGLRE